jgi:hypothetical protein
MKFESVVHVENVQNERRQSVPIRFSLFISDRDRYHTRGFEMELGNLFVYILQRKKKMEHFKKFLLGVDKLCIR